MLWTTKHRTYAELSNPTCDVILPNQRTTGGKIHQISDQRKAEYQPDHCLLLFRDERNGFPGLGETSPSEIQKTESL